MIRGSEILKNLFHPAGRINQTEFLLRFSSYLLVALLLTYPLQFLPELVRYPLELSVTVVLWTLIFIQVIRRVHDYDESAWYALLILVPLVNLYVVITAGTGVPNKYGNPPPAPSPVRQLLSGIFVLFPLVLMFLLLSIR